MIISASPFLFLNVKKIGITGAIGSGKTTVCKLFEQFGVPVYYADDAGKRLMNESAALKTAIIDSFGKDVYSESGELIPSVLSQLVFGNSKKLSLLNSLVHPAVGNDFQEWCETHKSAPYILKEAALMFESGSNQSLDEIVCVTAPLELRINRVMMRNGFSRSQVEERMQKQWSQERKLAASNFEIVNDGEHSLIEQVKELHKKFSA